MTKITLSHHWQQTPDKVNQLWLGNVLVTGFYVETNPSRVFSEGIMEVRWKVKKYWKLPYDQEDIVLSIPEAHDMCYQQLTEYGNHLMDNQPEWKNFRDNRNILYQGEIPIAEFHYFQDDHYDGWEYSSLWDFNNRYEFKPVASKSEAEAKCLEECNRWNESLRTEKELSLADKVAEIMNKFNKHISQNNEPN